MSVEKNNMVIALEKVVVPELRKRGFKGSFPHFRRISVNKIDLITFQFDRYGGGFVIEVGVCSPEGVIHHWGEKVPPNKVTAHDLHPDSRVRLTGNDGEWFRYDLENLTGDVYENVADKVFTQLNKAEEHWTT